MFSDIIPCGTMLKLCIYMDLTHHALQGLPAMQRVCLSHTMTATMIHMCHNNVMIEM